MDFEIPQHIRAYLSELDDFIAREIAPLQAEDDNERFFDHRREYARTDWEGGGLPRKEWRALLREMINRADAAGHFRYALPEEYGGKNGSNLAMAVIREHLAAKGLGLHNDLQNETSIVGNLPQILMLRDFGTQAQKKELLPGCLERRFGFAFALTEPQHGSDATWMETRAKPDTLNGKPGFRITGEKMWTTGVDVASHIMVFARTSGKDGAARGISCFLVPVRAEGVEILEWMWTYNMPTDHPRIALKDVWVGEDTLFGPLDGGLLLAQYFVHENRIRQAASSLGAAQYCIRESVAHAKARAPFGKPLASNQAIQFPLVEMQTEADMLRALIHKTAWAMDTMSKKDVSANLSDKVSMCNYRANRLVCEAADFAMQVHGAMGYSRHKPFEHIYRHHRRYRITEGAEEIQMRKIAGHMFGYIKRD